MDEARVRFPEAPILFLFFYLNWRFRESILAFQQLYCKNQRATRKFISRPNEISRRRKTRFGVCFWFCKPLNIHFLSSEKYRWSDRQRRRDFFDDFAEKRNFDPLVSSNWHSVTLQQIQKVSCGNKLSSLAKKMLTFIYILSMEVPVYYRIITVLLSVRLLISILRLIFKRSLSRVLQV